MDNRLTKIMKSFTGGKEMSLDVLANLLKADPKKLAAFESKYDEKILNIDSDSENFFDMNSKQAAKKKETDIAPDENPDLEEIINKIVNEFVNETPVFSYKRKRGDISSTEVVSPANSLKEKDLVTREAIMAFPEELRPQATSRYQKRDLKDKASHFILPFFFESQDESLPIQKRRMSYNLFRQGLDILDIDALLYDILGTNKNSIGYWFPTIIKPVDRQGFFKLPDTTIIKVPMNMLQLTRTDWSALTRITLEIVDRFCYKVFNLKEDGDYFIKTGTYSSKFDFRNCRVTSPKEVRELGEYLLFIQHQASQMAAPLNIGPNGNPLSIYGVSTTNEWAVREYIPDAENNPTIYKGLPLRTEYRVFVDFDTDRLLSINAYWDPDMMKKRFAEGADRSVHDFHDYSVYAAYEETLMKRYNENKDLVADKIKEIISEIDLSGQWSIDIMQNGNDFWIIDMALAEASAFYESVPERLRKPLKEDWVPKLDTTDILPDLS